MQDNSPNPSGLPPESTPPLDTPPIVPQPINGQKSGLSRHSRKSYRLIIRVVLVLLAIVVGSAAAAWLWYSVQLKPLASNKIQLVVVTVENGSTPSQIGTLLKEKSLIRSALAFDVNTRLMGVRGQLQAGTYRLSPGESTTDIINHLVSGKVSEFNLTFFPGATLAEHKKVLLAAGFSDAKIDAAFSKSYTTDAPLFDSSKPAGSDLEGYIYGETYGFSDGVTVEAVLQRTFDEFATVIAENNFIEGFKQRGLNLYQGITLASIIQREVSVPSGTAEPSSDQRQVSQVFYTRLDMGMPLGSDVTFIYAAKKLGVPPVSTLESPYNTRIVTGLPPGPIASPGITALRATASPASGDFVYFVAGDDGKTYFARTLEGHEANVSQYCTTECNKP